VAKAHRCAKGEARASGDISVDPFVKAGKMRFTRARDFFAARRPKID
jgi:hypothetical protein